MNHDLDKIIETADGVRNFAKILNTSLLYSIDNCEEPTFVLLISNLLEDKSEELFDLLDAYECKLLAKFESL